MTGAVPSRRSLLPVLGQISPDAIQAPEHVHVTSGGALAEAAGQAPDAPVPDAGIEAAVRQALGEVFDPELPVSVVDLGLIYRIDVDASRQVDIAMTLTAPACPVAGALVGQVAAAAATAPSVTRVQVRLVWDPPWSPARLDDETRLALGLL